MKVGSREEVRDGIQERFFNDVPIEEVKLHIQPIRPRTLAFSHAFNSIKDLKVTHRFSQKNLALIR